MQTEAKNEIVKINEAPDWMIDNIYLRTGYRKNFHSFEMTLKSILMKHNELLNIWTHLIGSLIFISMFMYLAKFGNSSKFNMPSYNENINRSISKSKTIFKDLHTEINLQMNNMFKDISSTNKISSFKNHFSNINSIKEKYLTKINEFKEQIEKKEIKILNLIEFNFNKYLDKFEEINFAFKKRYFELIQQNNDSIKNDFKDVADKFKSSLYNLTPYESLFVYIESDLELYPFLIYLACAIFCFTCSTIFHWFLSMSPTINRILLKLDLAGIAILIFGSSYGMFFYFFYCMPNVFNFYTTVNFICCVSVFCTILEGTINKFENTGYRSALFVALAFTNFIPLTHFIILSFYHSIDNDYLPINDSIYYLFGVILCYLIGFVFFIFKIPERFYPNTFDIWLNSHTIWHFFIFLASIMYFFGLCSIYSSRLNKPCLI